MYYAADREGLLRAAPGQRGPAPVRGAAGAQPDVRDDRKRRDNDGRERVPGRTGTRYATEDAEGEDNGVQRSRKAEMAVR